MAIPEFLSLITIQMHGKIPNKGNWKFLSDKDMAKSAGLWCMEKSQTKGIESFSFLYSFIVFIPEDAWKNPKQRELKVKGVTLWQKMNRGRCMEKSQTKGIESSWKTLPHFLHCHRMHGKIPNKGNWKYQTYLLSLHSYPTDAWKNPKQRELKDLFVGHSFGFSHGRCMEKSQTKGIESWFVMGSSIGLSRMGCMEKSQTKGIERVF